MKVLVFIFITLCFHLSSIPESAGENIHNYKIHYLPSLHIENTQQVESASQSYQITKDDSNKENEHLIRVEDDDENEDVIKKHILPASHFLTFSCAFISDQLCTSLADSRSFYKSPSFTSSSKYISQRVLRL